MKSIHTEKIKDSYPSDDTNLYYSAGPKYEEDFSSKLNPKFKTNIKINHFDEIGSINQKSRKELKFDLAELEKQEAKRIERDVGLSKKAAEKLALMAPALLIKQKKLDKELYTLLLFNDEPKYLLEKDKKNQVNNNYPFAYYDPTNTDKLNSIEELKKKIVILKKKLGLNSEVGFYITVNNSTFPHTPQEVLKNYEHSNYEVSHQIKDDIPKIINGKFENLQDVYNSRKDHLKIKKLDEKHNPQASKLINLKLSYDNQILDFIKHENLSKIK